MKQNIRSKHALLAACTLLAMSVAGSAWAQYVWLDAKGVKQFSDMPPPPSVPKSRILKAPGRSSVAPAAAASADSAATGDDAPAAAAPAASAPMTTAERNVEYNKRKQEQAGKDKKAADAEAKKSAREANCAQARDYQRTLDSGIRITQTGKNGEQSVMDDAQRAKAARDNRKALDDC